MSELPKDKYKAFTINGIKFSNRAEYDACVKEDAQKMAEFLYDMYRKEKRREKDVAQ